MSNATAAVVTRYLHAADTGDNSALASCFTQTGIVRDEGQTYTGQGEIRRWREDLANKYTYTTTITGNTLIGEGRERVEVRVEGDFPGGVADLRYDFVLAEGLIAELTIGA
jgi:hypothetical protein